MKIQRAYKVEIDPNNAQKTALLRHCGAARWVYNWGLARKIEAFQKHEKIPTAMTLAKEIRVQRAEVAPWLSEHSSYCIDSILPHCDSAFDNFFRRCKEKKKGKMGFPRFKSKHRGIGSMRFHKAYQVQSDRIRFPIIGWVRLKEHNYIPVTGTEGAKFYSATVSEKAGRWFVSVQVEIEVPEPKALPEKIVGVDFGIKTLATCSDGRTFENPKTLKRFMRKLKRAQRCLSRREKGSANRHKSKVKVAKIHARIANIRANTLHNLSSQLTRTKCVAIEDLNVAGMMKNHHLAQAISDCGFGELRRQLEYKAAWRGGSIVLVDRWYPSSKTCFSCGVINDKLTLAHRNWTCVCGVQHDRDLNAARNLAAWTPEKSSPVDSAKPKASRRKKAVKAVKKVAAIATDTSNACGEKSSGAQRIARETILCEAGSGQLSLFGTT